MPALTRLLNSLAPLRSHASWFLSQLSVSHLKRASEGLDAAGVDGAVEVPLLSSPLLLLLDEVALVEVLAMLLCLLLDDEAVDCA